MSRYSTLVNGKHQDIVFRNKQTILNSVHGPSNNYCLYIGDEYWGTVYDMHGTWTAVADKAGEMNLVEGFATRRDAGAYIIKYIKSGEGCSIHTTKGRDDVS